MAIAQIVIANMLGQERLGEYAIVFIPIDILILLQDPGISVGLTAHIARYHHQGLDEEKKSTLASGLLFNILISLIVASTVYSASPLIASYYLHRPDLEPLLRIASIAVFGQALITTTNAVFIGYGRMKLQSLSGVILAVARIILSPLLVFIGLGTIGAISGYSISIIMTGSIGLFIAITLLRNTKGKIEVSSMVVGFGRLIRYGVPVYMSTLINGALSQIYGSLMVLYVANIFIGNYSAAGNFSVLVGFVIGPISVAIFPLFSKLHRGDENLGRAFRSSVKYSSLFSLPILGALIALSHPFIGVLFGDRFPLAAYYLQLLTLIYVYIGIGSGSISSLLNGQGETRINLIGALIRLLIGGSLAFYLIPNYGIPGLIISMTVSQIPSLVYILVWIKRNLGISPDWRTSAKIFSSVIPSTMLTLIFVGTQSNLWIELLGGATIFVVSYLVLIKALRVLDATDYELFRAIVGDTGVFARLVLPLIDLLEYGDLTHVRAR